ncbi:MAG: hypothetical protein ACLPYS_07945 [Vulcanimicrobiaceae bacterium]
MRDSHFVCSRSAALLAGILALASLTGAGGAQPMPNGYNTFLGTWCAQGVPTARTSIVSGGAGLTLTNELGATSPGALTGINSRSIVAFQWNLVRGTLSFDGSQINWSNNTFWSRCTSGHVGKLDGTWYAQGDPSRACAITQRYGVLSFTNETGTTVTGAFDGPMHLSATWSGQLIGGTISGDGSRIAWDNGTFWTR